jgi:hypothetical protein
VWQFTASAQTGACAVEKHKDQSRAEVGILGTGSGEGHPSRSPLVMGESVVTVFVDSVVAVS